jgi:hypothetical protein
MAMYSAYFDESGDNHADFLVVAGAVADVNQWVQLEREWLDVLSPLKTTVFHATDFEVGNPPFDALSEPEKDDLFVRLVGIIRRRVERTCAGVISMEHYRISNQKYVLAEHYGFPYPTAARVCMGGVEEWAFKHSIPVSETLFFFEDGAKHKGQIEWIAERDSLPIPIFRKKADVVALQSGDLLAWLIHLLVRSGDDELPRRYVKALGIIFEMDNVWRDMNLNDPDRLPTILEVPLRDPRLKYECKIVRKDGRRHAAVLMRDKDAPGQFKVNRKNDQIPEIRHIPLEALLESAKRYDNAVKLKQS